MKMNKKQYNEIIKNSLNETTAENSLSSARNILKNMGVVFPNGNLKEVTELLKTNSFMNWNACTFQEAKAAANQGIAAIGISNNQISVIAADDESTDTFATAATNNTAQIQYFAYNNCCDDGDWDITGYEDRYEYELVYSFGFTPEVAKLIHSLYDRVDRIYTSESTLVKAWRCARVLSEFCYDYLTNIKGITCINTWNDVAGSVTDQNNIFDYFVNTLGYTSQQFDLLYENLISQHNEANFYSHIDFCHLQYSLAARLAFKLNKDGFFSNWGTGLYTGNYKYYTDEEISYLGGWLGDAVLTLNDNEYPTMGNDDYMSDLDAENLYQILLQGLSSVDTFSIYYSALTNCYNRAHIFTRYISYETVKDKVFYELIDTKLIDLINKYSTNYDAAMVKYYSDLLKSEQYHWDTLREKYYDTYCFLKSLYYRRATIGNFD